MGLLDNFERGLERAVNGAFAKTFRSGVQPVELASALRGELDRKAAVVSRERILVPNQFLLRLAPDDFERMDAIGPVLVDELTTVTQKHANQQGYSFAGGLSIALAPDTGLSSGMLEVDSGNVASDVTWTPVLDINGRRHTITKSRTVIGRGSDADITVDDAGTSRKHVEVLWDGSRAQVRDLGSTNGSQLNGRAVTQAELESDSVIQIGRTLITFRILAQARPTSSRGGGHDDATRRHDTGFWGTHE